MNVQTINAFIHAVEGFLPSMAQTKATQGKLYALSSKKLNGDLLVAVPLTVEGTQGILYFGFEKSSLLEIVSNMFMEQIAEIRPDVIDAAVEVSGTLAAQAKAELGTAGASLECGKASQIAGDPKISSKVVVLPFQTSKGSFFLQFDMG